MKSLAIADELKTECIRLTFDPVFYAKAQQVRWNHDMYMQRTVVKLGKCFENSELADILVEAGTVVQGSLPWSWKADTTIEVSVIKIMAEALRRKLLSTFMDTQSKKEKDKLIALSKSLNYAFPKIQFQHLSVIFWPSTRPKMPFKVMHRKEVTHSSGSYERKSHGRKLADEMGRAKKFPWYTHRLMHWKRVTCELHDSYFYLMTIKHSISNIEWALNYYIMQSRRKSRVQLQTDGDGVIDEMW